MPVQLDVLHLDCLLGMYVIEFRPCDDIFSELSPS